MYSICVAAFITAAVISMICSFQTLQITLSVHHRLILSESRGGTIMPPQTWALEFYV